MRWTLGLSALALMVAAPAAAQPSYAPPRGSYERLCSNISMSGSMMSATCRGAGRTGVSSINILSCASDISVDAEGGLTCQGPGAAPLPSYGGGRPGYGPRPPGGGYRPETASVFGARNWRGQAVLIEGEMPNLDRTGLNDRVRSVRLERRSRPWLVCTDANYRGRCVTVRQSVQDVRSIGMQGAISSMRPAY